MATDRTLHLSLDFELSDGVRLLAGQLGVKPDEAVLYVLRLFLDWGRQRADFRPCLTRSLEGGFSAEPLALLIEQSCGWQGEPGAFVAALVACRLLVVEQREELIGFVCPRFAADNPHLLPGYESMHSKGGKAKALRARMGEVEAAVPQTTELLQVQGVSLFAADVSEADQREALGLVMKIDAACGRSLRNASEYRGQQDVLKAALHRARRHTPDEIEGVLRYLMSHANSPAVSKDTAVILRDFDRYLRFACPPSRL